MKAALGLKEHLTHKGNLKNTRYGWLRLTPAYSVHLVDGMLTGNEEAVLDPFCGTGTTALVCSERGIPADTTDINPFLIWLAGVKAANYTSQQISSVREIAHEFGEALGEEREAGWVPPLANIEKWWDTPTLASLSWLIEQVRGVAEPGVADLLKIAFCRLMITRANVSFAHQSMSFKKAPPASLFHDSAIGIAWLNIVDSIATAAAEDIPIQPNVYQCDARKLTDSLPRDKYDCVITSPPYPNRMSYIRELRPYMYWLEYLLTSVDASEMDWQAIGGTWGYATSNVGKWEPPNGTVVPFDGFSTIIAKVNEHKSGTILSRYIHKYFYDMVHHVDELFTVVKPGGTVNYIVGNSKFYDVMLPVEAIFASLFDAAGFEDSEIKTIRKRTSKKELYEFVVSAKKPS